MTGGDVEWEKATRLGDLCGTRGAFAILSVDGDLSQDPINHRYRSSQKVGKKPETASFCLLNNNEKKKQMHIGRGKDDAKPIIMDALLVSSCDNMGALFFFNINMGALSSDPFPLPASGLDMQLKSSTTKFRSSLLVFFSFQKENP